MRRFGIVALLCACFAAQNIYAQDAQKTWIFFADKQDGFGKATQVEPGYLFDRAIERRDRRGMDLPEQLDAPLSPLYLDALETMGIEIVNKSRWLNAATALLDADQRAAVEQLPFVSRIRRVARRTTDAAPAIPVSSVVAQRASRLVDCGFACTQLEVVNAIKPIDDDVIGTGVAIGFVDTRFDPGGNVFDHSHLKHLADADRVRSAEFVMDDQPAGTPRQNSFHGLAVASVALAYDPDVLVGPCYGADSVYVAETEWGPSETNEEEDNFVAGVEWMEARGVDVINSSLGYTTFDAGEHSYTMSDMDGDTGITTIIFDMAAQRGVVTVSSAGNSGGSSWPIIGTPADGDSVIAVGGIHSDSALVGFSSRGPSADGRIKPDVTAQATGVFLAFADGSTGISQGTSFSSPMVAGIACQIVQVNPDLNPREVWEVLTSTAHLSATPNNSMGWGIVDAAAAVEKAKQLYTGFPVEAPDQPSIMTIAAPYPNPFSDGTHFEIELAHALNDVQVAVYNMLGQRVRVVHDGPLSAGSHTLEIQAKGLPGGLYTYVVTGGGETQSGMMVHVR